jgi:hypothetical protein
MSKNDPDNVSRSRPVTVDHLAVRIRRRVPDLRKICNEPGRERWRGRCPFHGKDRTPSFDVFQGRAGPRYYCHSCHAAGGEWLWLRKVEGKSIAEIGALPAPDPAVLRERAHQRRRERMLAVFYVRHPDAGPEWGMFLEDAA